MGAGSQGVDRGKVNLGEPGGAPVRVAPVSIAVPRSRPVPAVDFYSFRRATIIQFWAHDRFNILILKDNAGDFYYSVIIQFRQPTRKRQGRLECRCDGKILPRSAN